MTTTTTSGDLLALGYPSADGINALGWGWMIAATVEFDRDSIVSIWTPLPQWVRSIWERG